MSYDVNTMDALIMLIQMILVGRISSSRQTLYVLTLIGKQTYVFLLTLNKKRKMKIMDGVARLIFLVVVFVCVVICVFCFLQNNPVFLSVTISHISKNENYELCVCVCCVLCFVLQLTTRRLYLFSGRNVF
jgi:hypothetical protein